MSLFEARPIAIPATAVLIGTPASISERDEAQVEAIEDEPLDPNVSDTTLTV
jgi:hypothetical protein